RGRGGGGRRLRLGDRGRRGSRGRRRPRTRAGSGGEGLTAAGMLPAKWWDERVPGGSAKGWLFLVHPGPSLLVTATFVAVAGVAGRSAPSPLRAAQLAGAMLGVQFAIGIANDLADAAPDAVSKPFKPLARKVVPPRPAATGEPASAASRRCWASRHRCV